VPLTLATVAVLRGFLATHPRRSEPRAPPFSRARSSRPSRRGDATPRATRVVPTADEALAALSLDDAADRLTLNWSTPLRHGSFYKAVYRLSVLRANRLTPLAVLPSDLRFHALRHTYTWLCVVGWVALVVPLLLLNMVFLLLNAPRMVATAWDSGARLVGVITTTSGLSVAAAVLQLVFLIIPVVGFGLTFLRLGRFFVGKAREFASGSTVKAVGMALAAAVGILAFAWWPDQRERRTAQEKVAQSPNRSPICATRVWAPPCCAAPRKPSNRCPRPARMGPGWVWQGSHPRASPRQLPPHPPARPRLQRRPRVLRPRRPRVLRPRRPRVPTPRRRRYRPDQATRRRSPRRPAQRPHPAQLRHRPRLPRRLRSPCRGPQAPRLRSRPRCRQPCPPSARPPPPDDHYFRAARPTRTVHWRIRRPTGHTVVIRSTPSPLHEVVGEDVPRRAGGE